MKPYLLVTVDTEGDNLWSNPSTVTCENIRRLPRFHAICEEAGIRPTYLVSYEVVDDPEAAGILKRLAAAGGCEIGAHLHPRMTPPKDGRDGHRSGSERYAFELPVDLVQEKVARLTSRLEAMFGIVPRSMRWGRWALGASLVSILEAEGYWVDSSVTPGVAWPGSTGRRRGAGPAYWSAPAQPYFLDPKDVCRAGASSVLEAPVTIMFLRRCHAPVYRALRACHLGLLARRLKTEPRWLRPFPWMSAEDFLRIYRRGRSNGYTVFNLMLHSSELLPGASPYYVREEDVERMLDGVATFLNAMAQRGARGVTLQELYTDYRWASGGAGRGFRES